MMSILNNFRMLTGCVFLTGVFVLASAINPARADPTEYLNGVVVKVSDGDTVDIVSPPNRTFSVRFYGIDAPETKNDYRGWPAQPFSAEAKQFVETMIKGKTVSVRLKGELTYGRLVGEIFVNGVSVNREVVRAGFAWWNSKYEPLDFDLKRLAKSAKLAGKGLWSEPNPIAPWDWRDQNSFAAEITQEVRTKLYELQQLEAEPN